VSIYGRNEMKIEQLQLALEYIDHVFWAIRGAAAYDYAGVNIALDNERERVIGSLIVPDESAPQIDIEADGTEIVIVAIHWGRYTATYSWGVKEYFDDYLDMIGRLVAAGPLPNHYQDYETEVA
jgi:hypothetical protein